MRGSTCIFWADLTPSSLRLAGSSAEAVTMDDDQMASAVDNLAAMAESGAPARRGTRRHAIKKWSAAFTLT
jgi:hypothetical protein